MMNVANQNIIALLEGKVRYLSVNEFGKVQFCNEVELPLVDSDNLFDSGVLEDKFNQLFAEQPPAKARLLLSDHWSSGVLIPRLSLPAGGSVADCVEETLQREHNRDVSKTYHDFRVFRNPELGAMVYFINRRFLDQLLGVLRKKHVTIARTVPASAAIIASLLEHCPDAERKQLLYLHIGKDESLIIALQRGNPVLYRKLPMGYSMLTLKENQFILPVGELSASDDLHKISDQLTELGDGFHQLLAEIARCVKGVGIHFGAHGFFDFFHLSGLLTSNDDFSIYLEEFLHIPRLEFILPTEKLAKHQIARGPVWRPLFSLITRDEVKK